MEAAGRLAPDVPLRIAHALRRLAGDEGLRSRIAGREVFAARTSQPVLGERWRALLESTF